MLETLKKDWVFAGFKRPKDVFKPEYKHALLLLVMLGYIGLFFLSEYFARDNYHLVQCDLSRRAWLGILEVRLAERRGRRGHLFLRRAGRLLRYRSQRQL